jgi:predicted phosphodiesterase
MRILVVSDIHANLAALDAVIRAAGAFDRVWCLGDVVGYGPEPNQVIDLLRSFDLVCLAGNHDWGVVGRVSLGEFSQDARDAAWWTREQLNSSNLNWLETLAPMVVIPEHGITLVHASPRDPIWEYMIDPQIAAACLDAFETPVGLNGHTHIPVIFRKPTYGLGVVRERLAVNVPVSLTLDRMFVNPGSVGQPRDDDSRAAYAIVDPEAMTLTHYRVQYDVAATQKAMRQAHLPDRLIRRLRFGE